MMMFAEFVDEAQLIFNFQFLCQVDFPFLFRITFPYFSRMKAFLISFTWIIYFEKLFKEMWENTCTLIFHSDLWTIGKTLHYIVFWKLRHKFLIFLGSMEGNNSTVKTFLNMWVRLWVYSKFKFIWCLKKSHKNTNSYFLDKVEWIL